MRIEEDSGPGFPNPSFSDQLNQQSRLLPLEQKLTSKLKPITG